LSSSQLEEVKIETFQDVKIDVIVSTKKPMGQIPQFETFVLSFQYYNIEVKVELEY